MVNQNSGKRHAKANYILRAVVYHWNEMRTGCAENFIISKACLEFGAGRRYVLEVLNDLVNTMKLTRSEGKLYPSDGYIKELEAPEKELNPEENAILGM